MTRPVDLTGRRYGRIQSYRAEDDAFQGAMLLAFERGGELKESASAHIVSISRHRMRVYARAVNHSPMGSPGAMCASEG